MNLGGGTAFRSIISCTYSKIASLYSKARSLALGLILRILSQFFSILFLTPLTMRTLLLTDTNKSFWSSDRRLAWGVCSIRSTLSAFPSDVNSAVADWGPLVFELGVSDSLLIDSVVWSAFVFASLSYE